MRAYVKYIPYGKSYRVYRFPDRTTCVSLGGWKIYIKI